MDPIKQKKILDEAVQLQPTYNTATNTGGYSVEQLGEIARRAGITPSVSVTSYKDNPDGTTTNTLSDGTTSTVNYTKNADGSLNPYEVGSPAIASPYADQLKTFETMAKTGSAFTEADRQKEIEAEQRNIQRSIDALNIAKRGEVQRLREQTQQTLGGVGAQAARGGFAGTPFALGQSTRIEGDALNKENEIEAKYVDAVATMNQEAVAAADARLKAKQDAMMSGAEAYTKYLKEERVTKQKQLAAALTRLTQQGQDITSLNTKDLSRQFGLTEAEGDETLAGVLSEAQKAMLEKAPESVKEYEYAKKYGGYTGSYNQYQNEDANRKAAVARAGAQVLGQGGLTPQQATQFSGIVNNYSKSPLIAAKDRTIVLKDAIEKAKKNPTDGSTQLTLIYSYVQALDTYQSAVREGELSLVNSIDSKIGQINNYASKIQNGQIVRPEVVKSIATTAQNIVDAIDRGAQQKEQMYKAQANVIGLGPQWDEFSLQSKQIVDMGNQPQYPAGGETITKMINGVETTLQKHSDGLYYPI